MFCPYTNLGVTTLYVCVCSSRGVVCVCFAAGGRVVMDVCERWFCVREILRQGDFEARGF